MKLFALSGIFLAFAAAVFAVSAGGGGSGGAGSTQSCIDDSQCDVGKYCSSGACAGVSTACVSDGVCVSECGRARTPDPDCTATPSPTAAAVVSATPPPTPAASAAESASSPPIECASSTNCVTDGCSGQVCRSRNSPAVITTCEFREEFACLKKEACGCVGGKCAWAAEALECVKRVQSGGAGPTVPTSSGRPDECTPLPTLLERERCRMRLVAQGRYGHDYEHEECRALEDTAAKALCNAHYEKTSKCFEKKANAARFACVASALKLESLSKAKEACGNDAACRADLAARVHAAIKFRFYNLVERSGVLLKAGASEESIAQFAAFAETKKQEFNSAKSVRERIAIVEQVRGEWKSFKQNAIEEIRAKKS